MKGEANMNEIIQNFNKKNRKQRRDFFMKKLDTSNMRKRSPGIALGGNGATFIFDDNNDVCYVLRYYDRFKDELIATTVDDAEEMLEIHIEREKYNCECDGIQFGDAARCRTYINAADELLGLD
jgi:hypothetical protein